MQMSMSERRPSDTAKGQQGEACARHKHVEHVLVRRPCAGTPSKAKGRRVILEARSVSANGLPLYGVEHLLHTGSLRSVLTDTVHQILPHRHGGRPYLPQGQEPGGRF